MNNSDRRKSSVDYECPTDSRVNSMQLFRYMDRRIRVDKPEYPGLANEQAGYVERHLQNGCEPCIEEIGKQIDLERKLVGAFQVRNPDCPDLGDIHGAEFGLIGDNKRADELLGHRDNCAECSNYYSSATIIANYFLRQWEKIEKEDRYKTR